MRIGAQTFFRAGDAHQRQRAAGVFAGLAPAQRAVGTYGFDHLRVDPQHRIEGHHRVLKDHRYPVALNATQL